MMPPPPGHSVSTQQETPPLGTITPSKDATLTEDESSFILDTTLKDKHRTDPTVLAFIDSFIRCKNIAQASAECNVAPSVGYKWRHQKDIALAIQKLIDKSSIKYGFDASEIIERTKEMVDFDPIEMQNPDGSFKSNLHDIAPEARRNLKKMKCRNIWGEQEDLNGVTRKIIIGELIEYEFYDKQKAIELVGKEKDMFKTTSKVIHEVSENMASILLDATKRGERASLEMQKPRDVVGEVVNITEGASHE